MFHPWLVYRTEAFAVRAVEQAEVRGFDEAQQKVCAGMARRYFLIYVDRGVTLASSAAVFGAVLGVIVAVNGWPNDPQRWRVALAAVCSALILAVVVWSDTWVRRLRPGRRAYLDAAKREPALAALIRTVAGHKT